MASTVSAHDIQLLSDTQLAIFVEAHKGDLPVRDPQNLTAAFHSRLRTLTFPTLTSSVDAEDLSSRLLELDTASSIASTLEDPHELRDDLLDQEKKAYQELVTDGGRPWCTLEFLERVSQDNLDNKDQDKHAEVLRFWRIPNAELDRLTDPTWSVFSQQLQRWRQFRKWQAALRQSGSSGQFCVSTEKIQQTLHSYSFIEALGRDLSADTGLQDDLVTWIEYLYWEVRRLRNTKTKKNSEQWLHWVGEQVSSLVKERKRDLPQQNTPLAAFRTNPPKHSSTSSAPLNCLSQDLLETTNLSREDKSNVTSPIPVAALAPGALSSQTRLETPRLESQHGPSYGDVVLNDTKSWKNAEQANLHILNRQQAMPKDPDRSSKAPHIRPVSREETKLQPKDSNEEQEGGPPTGLDREENSSTATPSLHTSHRNSKDASGRGNILKHAGMVIKRKLSNLASLKGSTPGTEPSVKRKKLKVTPSDEQSLCYQPSSALVEYEKQRFQLSAFTCLKVKKGLAKSEKPLH